MPDKWIRVRPNSHRDSAKTDDRPLKPRTVAFALRAAGWNGGEGKKHLTFISLFILNFRSFSEILEIRPGTTNHHNEFAISIFSIQNTLRVCLCGAWREGGGNTRQRPTKSCENHYLWCSRYIIIAVPLLDCCIYYMCMYIYISRTSHAMYSLHDICIIIYISGRRNNTILPSKRHRLTLENRRSLK